MSPLRPDLEQQPEETWEQQPEVQAQEEPQEEEQVNTSEKHFPEFCRSFFFLWGSGTGYVAKWIEPRSDFESTKVPKKNVGWQHHTGQ